MICNSVVSEIEAMVAELIVSIMKYMQVVGIEQNQLVTARLDLLEEFVAFYKELLCEAREVFLRLLC